jgi:hypothetical protein
MVVSIEVICVGSARMEMLCSCLAAILHLIRERDDYSHDDVILFIEAAGHLKIQAARLGICMSLRMMD